MHAGGQSRKVRTFLLAAHMSTSLEGDTIQPALSEAKQLYGVYMHCKSVLYFQVCCRTLALLLCRVRSSSFYILMFSFRIFLASLTELDRVMHSARQEDGSPMGIESEILRLGADSGVSCGFTATMPRGF